MQTKKVKRAVCPRCRDVHILESHHILPRKHYGDGVDNPFTILLCSNCHKDIGELVHNSLKKSPEQYFQITWSFVKREPIFM
jgi:hypothetical protein